ncbi:hypothetical protein [Vibrio sp. ER1A]|uniref:hypothetical protein n=1 Tax=Vibrio sp. ER1A TaxID=1517681 RepID=UPI0004DD538D|nr:hypothetical protein [Vibrio sp. ER1A]KFA99386.1 hypothetical protein HW45_04115 [Vibrio sp. ER1A]
MNIENTAAQRNLTITTETESTYVLVGNLLDLMGVDYEEHSRNEFAYFCVSSNEILVCEMLTYIDVIEEIECQLNHDSLTIELMITLGWEHEDGLTQYFADNKDGLAAVAGL